MGLVGAMGFAAVWPWLVIGAPLDAEKNEPPASSLSEQQVKSEIERLQAEKEKRENGPDAPPAWKERRKLEAKFEELRQKQRTDRQPLDDRITELLNDPAARRWSDEIERIENRLEKLRIEDYKFTRDAGRKLYQARHAELTKLAVTDTPELRRLNLDVLKFPRLDGSTSTRSLTTLIACRNFNMPYEWSGVDQRLERQIEYDVPSSKMPFFLFGYAEPELKLLEFTLQAKADRPAQDRLAMIINRLLAINASTHQAYVNLIEGHSDLGLLARAPSADELALARKMNVELEVTACAWDAFIFLVNEENPVRNLSTAQIRDIYSAKVHDWSEVGGQPGRVVPYQREENSGSQELMRTLVMKDRPIAKPSGEFAHAPQLIGSIMSSVYLQLTGDKEGLGYSVYYYERFMAGSPRTRMIAVDGIEPTYENLRDRKYPYAAEVFIVTQKGLAADSPTARLRSWLLTSEGQSVVRESGYVPLEIGKR